MSERRNARRAKSFLRGFVYVSRKQDAVPCMIRDVSETGARIAFSDKVSLPDTVELYIPQRKQTLRAKVCWRRGDEVGLAFNVSAKHSDAPAKHADVPVQPAADGPFSKTEVVQRVAMLEAEIASLRSVLKRLKREKPGRDGEEAA